jgi:hypothetical protein
MFFHKEMRGHRTPLDVSDQQRDHVAAARDEIERQKSNRKQRKGRVIYV